MAFADRYPLEAFLAISHLSWWRASNIDSEVSRRKHDAAKTGHPEWTAPSYLLEIQKEARAADAADKAPWDAGKEVFQTALAAHIDDLRLAGRLAPTGGVRGRDVWQATAWNALVADANPDHHRRWLINGIGNVLTSVFVRMDDGRYARRAEQPLGAHSTPTREQAVAAWTRLCGLLDAGDTDEFHDTVCVKEIQDGRTGDRCQLHFADWKAVLMRYDASYRLEPAADVGPVPLVAASFDVPTGELLLTDFLRIEGMDAAIDLGEDEYGAGYDLNDDTGQAKRSAAHAERHRMGFCQTTNTSVAVWRDPATGVLAVVDRWSGDESDEVDGAAPIAGWTRVGDFSCDMWRITAVDAQVARELTSAAEVDRYLALRDAPIPTKGLPVAEANRIGHDNCYAANVVSVAVEPGRWTIHCGSDFAKRLPRHRYGLPKGVEPWCVLTPPSYGAAKRRRAN